MMLSSLIFIPLLLGIVAFLAKSSAKVMALLGSLTTLVISGYLSAQTVHTPIAFSMPWIPQLGTQFSLLADGMSAMLCLLTAIVMTAVVLANWDNEIERPTSFWGLMLLSQAGITGVFLASDVLLFYFFWELAIIPVYFLCSRWGGERRIAVTFKFFVYTFLGSLMMLAAIIYLAMLNPGADAYSWANITRAGASLSPENQTWLFWLFFGAFAIKMPVFPFHTWQPDTYEQAATPVTIILSALMVKMGLYAVIRWLFPALPDGVAFWSNTVIILSIIGIVYGSFLALSQTDLKRLVAYSSLAHMGLMCAAAFAKTQPGMHGLMVQMFNHGINITGMWLIVQMIENRWGSRDMTKLGGMATGAPHMAIALVILAYANIALPLTNGFVGEFMMFHGIFQSATPYHITFMVIAGLGVILGAAYTLKMVQKTAFGSLAPMVVAKDMSLGESAALAFIIALVIFLGVYPKPLLDLTGSVAQLMFP
ncbi:MAG: NADH-quinone oxidoreductase subunit M [Bacteroidetes bacterium]|nr:NADH-quinone oxidoreductase subunit M [Bacteroidota bacterium]MBS1739274.1 NADH-quinone oxidoreductase subunit M [Bacteroidota bacterium]